MGLVSLLTVTLRDLLCWPCLSHHGVACLLAMCVGRRRLRLLCVKLVQSTRLLHVCDAIVHLLQILSPRCFLYVLYFSAFAPLFRQWSQLPLLLPTVPIKYQ